MSSDSGVQIMPSERPRPSPRCSEEGGETSAIQPCSHPKYISKGWVIYVKAVYGTGLWDTFCYLINKINEQNPSGISPGGEGVIKIECAEYRIYRYKPYIKAVCNRYGLTDPAVVSTIRTIDRILLPVFDPADRPYCNVQGELIIAWEQHPLLHFDYLSDQEPVQSLPLFPSPPFNPRAELSRIFQSSVVHYNPFDPLIVYDEGTEGARDMSLFFRFLLPHLESFFSFCSFNQIFSDLKYGDLKAKITEDNDFYDFFFDMEYAILQMRKSHGPYQIKDEACKFVNVIKRTPLLKFIKKFLDVILGFKLKYSKSIPTIFSQIKRCFFSFRCPNKLCRAHTLDIIYSYIIVDDEGTTPLKGIDINIGYVICGTCQKRIFMRDVTSVPLEYFFCFVEYRNDESDVYIDGLAPPLSTEHSPENFGPFFIQSLLIDDGIIGNNLFIRCGNQVYLSNEAGCFFNFPGFDCKYWHNEGDRHNFGPEKRCSAYPYHKKGTPKIGFFMLKVANHHKQYALAHQFLLQREGGLDFSGEERKSKTTEEMTEREQKLSEAAKLILSNGYDALYTNPIDVDGIDLNFLRSLLLEVDFGNCEKLYGISTLDHDESIQQILKAYSVCDYVDAGIVAFGVILFVKQKQGYTSEQCEVFSRWSKKNSYYPISKDCAYKHIGRGREIDSLPEILKTHPEIRKIVCTQQGKNHYWQWLIDIPQQDHIKITLYDSLNLGHAKEEKESFLDRLRKVLRDNYGDRPVCVEKVQMAQHGCNCGFFCILHTLHVAYPDIIKGRFLTNHDLIKNLRKNFSIIMAARALRLIDPL